EHPVLDLLYRPNHFMSGRSLRQWIIASLELTGNAYVLKDKLNSRGEPRELFPLLSQLVEVIPGKSPEEPIVGYKYRAGAKTAYYKASDIIHFKYFNPFDFFYGLSPLAAARKSIENLDKAETYNRAFFDNCGTLSGILYTEGKLDEQSRTRIINAWNSKYRSAAKAHQVALLEGGLKWQNTALSQKDMDFISSMQLSRETILAVFHVPPALVGVFEHSPQFTTKEQQRIFWQTCIHPKQTLMLETLTEFLLPHFDPSCTMYFDKDISNISALKEDELARAQAAKLYFEMGFSKNEIITALGLPLSPAKNRKGEKIK
ncbi:MAG: phage portal protein, partial [Elusimicrobiaceae bacterium]|nr:phage portal protein [Elusimicrobiaceae bacterium]